VTEVYILLSGNKLQTANVYSQSRIVGVYANKETAEEQLEARSRFDRVDKYWIEKALIQ